MKGLILLLLLIGGMIFVLLTAKKPTQSVGFQPAIIAAPEDVGDYPPENAIHHGDGLYSRVIEPATNDIKLRQRDFLKIEYTGWRASDGEMIDHSKNAGKPLLRRVDEQDLIVGWKRLLPLFKEGEKRRIWVPKKLAYGDTRGGKLADRLVFDMKILEVIRSVPNPVFEQYPTSPTTDSYVSPSGFKSLVTKEVAPSIKPKPSDLVIAQITKWNPSGELEATTAVINRPTQLTLSNMIPALKEGIPLMNIGEKRRFWVPEKSESSNNEPNQSWVYDIELLSISK